MKYYCPLCQSELVDDIEGAFNGVAVFVCQKKPIHYKTAFQQYSLFRTDYLPLKYDGNLPIIVYYKNNIPYRAIYRNWIGNHRISSDSSFSIDINDNLPPQEIIKKINTLYLFS